ncbi:hypothetical protein M0813_00604 [Anaeramoeba flamelloides]|uniref:DUF1152 domain-containing protein n=1 Tax=Anaeramoeba flamelloides TaxID=1746091 RepID=A0AAV8AAI0_9EUKA|nr:hypothetical protein M0812_06742 [Anaeramoeba flamelloides]KAJ6233971.1 hypothetical protein M0813_00604 [Anaeramoeba flamelloides]
MFQCRFLKEIEQYNKFLVCGCGGGFDVYSSIPLVSTLRSLGKTVEVGNLTFMRQIDTKSKLHDQLYKVTSKTKEDPYYFPERDLVEYAKNILNEEWTIWVFAREGYKHVSQAYQALVDHLETECVIIVDGGTDSLMFGDEDRLGTPEEDIVSILSVADLKGPQCKVLISVGFNVDSFHGVRGYQFLENVSSLIKTDGYWGLFQYYKDDPNVKKYIGALDYITKKRETNSIVNCSIVNSIEGGFGNDQRRMDYRTNSSVLFINPIMSVCWCFDLLKVSERIMYKKQLKKTVTRLDVQRVIVKWRKKLEKKKKIKKHPQKLIC